MSEPTGLQVMLDQWDERGMAAQAYPETFIAAFVKAARLVANPNYLRAAIGYGITLQEAIDIVDLALGGGTMTPTLQRIYEKEAAAALTPGTTDTKETL